MHVNASCNVWSDQSFLYEQNLDVTVTLYNRVRETILDVEYPLIEDQLADIDRQLEGAISQLNWTSEGDCVWTHFRIDGQSSVSYLNM